MKTREIKRLWNGYASLRDYEVKEAISNGGIILTLKYTEDRMTLLPVALEQGISTTKHNHTSKFFPSIIIYSKSFKK